MKPNFAFASLFVISLSLLTTVLAAQSAPENQTYAPLADGYVNDSWPTRNYGTANSLRVDGAPFVRSFLRFEVQGIRGTVNKATLRLYALTDSAVGATVQRVTDNTWDETTLNAQNAPFAGKIINLTGSFSANSWIEVDLTSRVTGTGPVSVALSPRSEASLRFASRETSDTAPQLVIETNPPTETPTATAMLPPTETPTPTATLAPTETSTVETPTVTTTPSESSAVILAAGDIANCERPGDEATAQLLDNLAGTVLTLGDNTYPDGTAQQFNDCYDPTWGRVKDRTRPSPGNHDYHVPDAAAYFAYFGSAAGPSGRGYYSFSLGDWHLIALDSEIDVTAGSPQEQWLRADLAAQPNLCTLAYWHQPRFSSGPHGSNTKMQPLWQALYEAGADVVLSGHDHIYERFAPQAPDGTAEATRGLREFVVGTGGSGLYPIVNVQPNSEVRNNDANGVLRMTLRADSYGWEFVPEASKTFTDVGSANCH